MLVLADFSVYLRALLPLCALAKNDHFMPRVTEECCQALIQLENGSVLAYLRPGGAVEFCHGRGASEQPLAHGSLCREAISKKHISNHVVDGRREWDRVPCLQTEKAASLTSFIGYDPLLH